MSPASSTPPSRRRLPRGVAPPASAQSPRPNDASPAAQPTGAPATHATTPPPPEQLPTAPETRRSSFVRTRRYLSGPGFSRPIVVQPIRMPAEAPTPAPTVAPPSPPTSPSQPADLAHVYLPFRSSLSPLVYTRLKLAWAPRLNGNLLPLPPMSSLLRFYLTHSSLPGDLSFELAAVSHFNLLRAGRRAVHAAFDLHQDLKRVLAAYDVVLRLAMKGGGFKMPQQRFQEFVEVYSALGGREIRFLDKISLDSYSAIKMRPTPDTGKSMADDVKVVDDAMNATPLSGAKRLFSRTGDQASYEASVQHKRLRPENAAPPAAVDAKASQPNGESAKEEPAADAEERKRERQLEADANRAELEARLAEARVRILQADAKKRQMDDEEETRVSRERLEARARRLKEVRESAVAAKEVGMHAEAIQVMQAALKMLAEDSPDTAEEIDAALHRIRDERISE